MDGLSPVWVEVTPENIEALAHAAIRTNNPRTHMACDWLRNPLAFGLLIFPERIYEIIRANKMRAEQEKAREQITEGE
jgi:hypothetical protein